MKVALIQMNSVSDKPANIAAARALALVRGRDYVLPQDVLEVAPDVLRHRLVLSYDLINNYRSAADRLLAAWRLTDTPEGSALQAQCDWERGHQALAFADTLHVIANQATNPAGLFRTTTGQLAYFVGHPGQATPMLTRPCRLDRGIERQQVGLEGNIVDGCHHGGHLLIRLVNLLHGLPRLQRHLSGLLSLIRHLIGHALGLMSIIGVLTHGGGHLLHARRGFHQRGRLLFGALSQQQMFRIMHQQRIFQIQPESTRIQIIAGHQRIFIIYPHAFQMIGIVFIFPQMHLQLLLAYGFLMRFQEAAQIHFVQIR